MFGAGEYTPVSELCQSRESNGLCREILEEYASRVQSLCFFIMNPLPPEAAEEDREMYEDLRNEDNFEFCNNALPPHRLSTGRVISSVHLPTDRDELPETVREPREQKYANEDDMYVAMMDGDVIPMPEINDRHDRLSLELFAAFDLSGIRTELHSDGRALNVGDRRSPTTYDVHTGGGFDILWLFDLSPSFDLYLSAGAEYYLNYSPDGANIHNVHGRPGLGLSLNMTESSDFLLGIIGRLGYQWSDGYVFHPATDRIKIHNFDASVGATIGWKIYSGNWLFGLNIEGFWTLTHDVAELPPIEFNLGLRTGYRFNL